MIKDLNIRNLEQIKKESERVIPYDSVILSLPIFKEDLTTPFNESLLSSSAKSIFIELINTSIEFLADDSYLFIYGSPVQLTIVYKYINKMELKFRHWIAIDAIDSIESNPSDHLKHSHVGLLMLSKGKTYPPLNTKETKAPHIACLACNKNIKDWGGKKHLMNIKGTGISDVWRDFYEIEDKKKDPHNPNIKLNVVNPLKGLISIDQNKLPDPVKDRIFSLIDAEKKKVLIINVSKDLLLPLCSGVKEIIKQPIAKEVSNELENKVILGDCIKEMEKLSKKYPSGVFDLVFADPPYNLQKKYKVYNDELADQEYINWCDKWIELCVRLTKPTGSVFILNIPKWSLEHSKTLNEIAYLQNWIVWDALSTPKGKIMPAHYSLLHYTKNPKDFTFNKPAKIPHMAHCARNTCVGSRNNNLLQNEICQVEVSDIWSDLYRIKHKIDRDDHPCQLPDKLMDRIIKVFSNVDDLVFDPFAGAGTTAIRAILNNRKYTTIEIDPSYKKITEEKLRQIEKNGSIFKEKTHKKLKTKYTKKYLETKVQELAVSLGKKPTLEEFVNNFSLNRDEIGYLYNDPRNVLKASRVSLLNFKN